MMPVLYPFALLALFLIFAAMVRKTEVSTADPRQDAEIAHLRERVTALERLMMDPDRVLKDRFDKL